MSTKKKGKSQIADCVDKIEGKAGDAAAQVAGPVQRMNEAAPIGNVSDPAEEEGRKST